MDTFQDLRYDTWVLQQVGIRLITNQNCRRTQDGRILNAVNPLSSFLNHSCEPNAACHTAPAGYGANVYGGSTSVVGVATEPIKKGEEICIDYCHVSHVRDKAVRRKILRSWLPNGIC